VRDCENLELGDLAAIHWWMLPRIATFGLALDRNMILWFHGKPSLPIRVSPFLLLGFWLLLPQKRRPLCAADICWMLNNQIRANPHDNPELSKWQKE